MREVEVAEWVKVAAANSSPEGHAVLGAVCRGVISNIQPGTSVEVADNTGPFVVKFVDSQLGVLVLQYVGDVDALALNLPTEGATIYVP